SCGLEDRFVTGWVLVNLGRMLIFAGDRAAEDPAAARALLEECVAQSHELGDRRQTAVALALLEYLAHEQGDVESAAARAVESLQLLRAGGFRWYLPEGLEL